MKRWLCNQGFCLNLVFKRNLNLITSLSIRPVLWFRSVYQLRQKEDSKKASYGTVDAADAGQRLPES